MPKVGAALPAPVKPNPPLPLAGAPPPPGTYTNVKKPKTTKKTAERPGTMPLGKPQPIDPIEAEKAKLE